MNETFRHAATVLAFGAALSAPLAEAQDARRGMSRFDVERGELMANMYEDLGDIDGLSGRVISYLQTNTNLGLCESNLRAGPYAPLPTIESLTGTTYLNNLLTFSPRSEFLAREDSGKREARDIIFSACRQARSIALAESEDRAR